MATIRPFTGIHYTPRHDLPLSDLIAPPYDVLDEIGKSALQKKHPNNIVSVDLPWLPPKTVGPDEVYARANETVQAWFRAGILHRAKRPGFYPYVQTYTLGSKTYHRRGFFGLVKLSPFGQGQVVPHEKTYAAPIEDRLKLMRSTGMQLSPIFGLFSDPRGEINKHLFASAGKPLLDGTLDNVRSQLWEMNDADLERQIIDLMRDKPIYIADGHHRYTTALQYQKEMEAQHGGPLPPNDPANYCLFVMVSMQDDGLVILPTHRLIGNVPSFDITKFKSAIAENFDVLDTSLGANAVEGFIDKTLMKAPPHTFGLYDARSQKLYQLNCKNPDLLKKYEPGQSDSWRKLDVAILQRYLLDEVITPQFAGGKELLKGYTAYSNEVVPKTDGTQFQFALLIKSTPLHALEELGKTNEVMPQKSTFFFPKLATGMVINPLR